MTTTSSAKWALGIPLESSRSLTDQECDFIRKTVKRLRLRALLLWLSYTLAWTIFLWSASFVRTDNDVGEGILTLVAIGLTGIALPCVILVGKDSLRRARLLAKDVTKRQVYRFVGPLTDESRFDPAYSRLVSKGLIASDQQAKLVIEVLTGSSRIWAVNEVSTKSWIEVYVADVAEVPSEAATTTEWLPMEEREANDRVGKRKLTDLEKIEMTQHARRCWRRPLPWTIGFTIWILMPIAVLIGQGHLDHPSYYIQMAFVGIGAVVAYVAQFKGLAMARALGRDRDDGEVMVIEIDGAQELTSAPHGAGECEANDEPTTSATPDVIWGEMLIHTSVLWSENGEVASWRKGS